MNHRQCIQEFIDGRGYRQRGRGMEFERIQIAHRSRMGVRGAVHRRREFRAR